MKTSKENKKYKFTGETMHFYGYVLHRIRALVDIPRHNVKKGDLGGWIEKEHNLNYETDAWVSGNAKVYGYAEVYENACISGNAQVYGNAKVYGAAEVFGYDNVYSNPMVYGNAQVYDNAKVSGTAQVYGYAVVYENACISGNAEVYDNASVYENASISSNAEVAYNAEVYGAAEVFGYAYVYSDARVYKTTHTLNIGPIGSREDYVTFVRSIERGIMVSCGCFNGTLSEFIEKVKKTHAGTKHYQTYMAACNLAVLQIEDTNQARLLKDIKKLED